VIPLFDLPAFGLPGTRLEQLRRELEMAGRIALVIMIATQILWSGYALFYDHYYAYSPDPAAAKFFKPICPGRRNHFR